MFVVTIALVLGLSVVACTEADRPASESSASGLTPYLLLDADGWVLEGGATAGSLPGGLPRGGLWTLAYVRRPEPNRSIGASLMVARPNQPARQLASESGAPLTDVRVDGVAGVAFEEHSPQDGHLVATHVLWDVGGFVAWFTIYEIRQDEAVDIAQHSVTVTEAEWHSTVDPVIEAQSRSS